MSEEPDAVGHAIAEDNDDGAQADGLLTKHGRELTSLAVRLQKMFGWDQAPRLTRGTVPVLLELLSPGSDPLR